MLFPSKSDKIHILFNRQNTIENIPSVVYKYVVNGKSAIEWVMGRYVQSRPAMIAAQLQGRGSGQPVLYPVVLLSVIRWTVETVNEKKGLPEEMY